MPLPLPLEPSFRNWEELKNQNPVTGGTWTWVGSIHNSLKCDITAIHRVSGPVER